MLTPPERIVHHYPTNTAAPLSAFSNHANPPVRLVQHLVRPPPEALRHVRALPQPLLVVRHTAGGHGHGLQGTRGGARQKQAAPLTTFTSMTRCRRQPTRTVRGLGVDKEQQIP